MKANCPFLVSVNESKSLNVTPESITRKRGRPKGPPKKTATQKAFEDAEWINQKAIAGRYSEATQGYAVMPLYGVKSFSTLTACDDIHPEGRPLCHDGYCEVCGAVGKPTHPVWQPSAVDLNGKSDMPIRIVKMQHQPLPGGRS